MKLSPVYSWPIAEPNDARRDYPTTVDDPRTLAIENTVKAAGAKFRAGNLAVPALGGVEAGSCTMLNATFSTPFVGALPIVVATLDWVPATTGLTVGYNNPAATPDQLNAFLHIGTISLAGPQFLIFFPTGNNISAGQLSINYLAYQI